MPLKQGQETGLSLFPDPPLRERGVPPPYSCSQPVRLSAQVLPSSHSTAACVFRMIQQRFDILSPIARPLVCWFYCPRHAFSPFPSSDAILPKPAIYPSHTASPSSFPPYLSPSISPQSFFLSFSLSFPPFLPPSILPPSLLPLQRRNPRGVPLEGHEGHETEAEHKDEEHAHVEGELVGGSPHVGEDGVSSPEGTDHVEAAVDGLVRILVDDDGMVGVPGVGGREGRREKAEGA